MKISKAIWSVACVIPLVGCMSTTVSMFPVAGPYSKQAPLPTIEAKASNIISNSGPMTVTLPDGQSCAGKWASVAPQQVLMTSGSLFSVYGSAAGFNTITSSNVPGINGGQAFMSCSGGTTIEADFFTGSGTASGYGIAKDSAGNVYKMIF